MSRQAPTFEEIFVKHELDIILHSNLQYRDKPDLEYIDTDGNKHGIEVVEACSKLLREYDSTRNKKIAEQFNKKSLVEAYGVHFDTKHGLYIHNNKLGLHMIADAINKKSIKVINGSYSDYNSMWLAIMCDMYVGFINDYIDGAVKQLKPSIFEKIIIISYNDQLIFEIHNKNIIRHKMYISNQNDDLKKLVIKEYLGMESSEARDREVRKCIRYLLKWHNANNYNLSKDIKYMTVDKDGINSIVYKYSHVKNFID